MLLDGVEDALSGSGRVFLIVGEAGIGKTRLASEIAGEAESRGARVLWGGCWEAGGAPAYWPWVRSIRAYLRDADPERLREALGPGATSLELLVPELREAFPDLPEVLSLDADGARFRLFDDTARFLRNVAQDEPLVLVFDDLHAADTPSVLLLRFAAHELQLARVFIIALAREVARDHPLGSASAEILRHRNASLLALTGLDEPDVGRFIETATGISAPKALVSVVHEETEGNPLFVEEVVKLLQEEGRLGDPGASLDRVSVPMTVREVIGRRLANLSEECLGLLTIASVLGRDFGLNALRSLSGLSDTELLGRLDEASSAHALKEVPGALGRWRFTHALIREVLYEELGASDRTRLHRRVGETIEVLQGQDPEAHLAELAHHFFYAAPGGDVERAVDYSRRAGDHAIELLAYEEAARLYRMGLQALDLIGTPEDETRSRLLLALGDAQARGGEISGSKASFLRAAAVARKSGSAELLGTAALGYAGRFVWTRAGTDRRLVPLLEEALAAVGDRDSTLRAMLLARLSGALRDRPPRELAAEVSEQAVGIARRLGDPATLSYALEGRFAAIWWPENPEERLAIATEMLRLAEEAGDVERIIQGHDFRVCALIELGDLASVHAELESESQLVRDLRQPAQRWLLTFTRAMLALFEGRFDEAATFIDASQTIWEAAQRSDIGTFSYRVQIYFLRREQGRLDEVEGLVERSIAEYPTRLLFRCLLPHLYAELGRTADAKGALDSIAGGDFADLFMDNDWLLGLSLLAEVVGPLRDVRRAAVLYELLIPFASKVPFPGEVSTGSLSRALGILASTMSRWDEAARHFEDALQANERMGARPWLAHTRVAFARMLRSRDGPGDRERAVNLLAQASETCREIGMVALQDEISRLLDEPGRGPAPPAPSLPAAAAGHHRLPSVFRKEGEYWSISFEGDAFRLRDSKGLAYLSMLLASPGREIPALELATAALGHASSHVGPARFSERGLHVGGDDAGEILDDRARSEYRRRLADLEEELGEAEEWSDLERATRAREEIDFLERELTAAVGLGGRGRRAASNAERARVSVTKAIRAAMGRIREHSTSLADHLASTIRTGAFCSYTPDPRLPTAWQR